MKFELSNRNLKWAAIAMGLMLGGTMACDAASGGNTKPAAATATTTNAGPPKAVFTKPSGPAEGKDPFYPKSVYPYLGVEKTPEIPKQTPTPTIVDVDVKLNGISGTKDRPLAIINGHTFEAGEEWEVNVGAGTKAHVKCVEIKPEGVLIFVNGQRRDLKLRGGI